MAKAVKKKVAKKAVKRSSRSGIFPLPMKGPGIFRLLLDQGHECEVERDKAGDYHFAIPADAFPPPMKEGADHPHEAMVSFILPGRPASKVMHRVVTLWPDGGDGKWTVHDSTETIPAGLLPE